jgi:hypothetical protein
MQEINFEEVKAQLDDGREVQVVVEFRDKLSRIAGGAYDEPLLAFGQAVARDGRQVTMRMLHEFNG